MGSNRPTFIMKRHFVLYLDLLGYKQIFNSDTKTRNNYLETIHSIYYDFINNVVNKIKELDSTARFQMFSDNLVLAIEAPVNDSEEDIFGKLISLLLPTSSLQIQLIGHNKLPMPIPVRGVITIGDLYIDETYVTGDALVSAHKIESCKENGIGAIHPRIVIDNEVCKIYQDCLLKRDELCRYSQIIKKDDDGLYFLNYLDQFESFIYFFNRSMDERVLKTNLKSHKISIEKCFINYTKDKDKWLKVGSKYEWMKQYHNTYCLDKNVKSFLIE